MSVRSRRPGPAKSTLGRYVTLRGLGWTDDAGDLFTYEYLDESAPVYGTPPFYPDMGIETAAPTSGSWWDQYGGDVISAIKSVGTAYLTLEQQKELNDLNMSRAQRGLLPLSPSQFAPQVNVGMSQDTKKLLLYAALAGGAVLLLSSSRRRA